MARLTRAVRTTASVPCWAPHRSLVVVVGHRELVRTGNSGRGCHFYPSAPATASSTQVRTIKSPFQPQHVGMRRHHVVSTFDLTTIYMGVVL